jgi:hypothetical protein
MITVHEEGKPCKADVCNQAVGGRKERRKNEFCLLPGSDPF